MPFKSTFLLFNSIPSSSSTSFYKYDGVEEEFHPMPVSLSGSMREYEYEEDAFPILVDLEMFPATIMSPGLQGKILSFKETKCYNTLGGRVLLAYSGHVSIVEESNKAKSSRVSQAPRGCHARLIPKHVDWSIR